MTARMERAEAGGGRPKEVLPINVSQVRFPGGAQTRLYKLRETGRVMREAPGTDGGEAEERRGGMEEGKRGEQDWGRGGGWPPTRRCRLTDLVEVPAAECERAKVLVDRCQQLLGARQPQRDVAHVELLHVVRALEVLPHVALPGGAKHLNGKELASSILVASLPYGGEAGRAVVGPLVAFWTGWRKRCASSGQLFRQDISERPGDLTQERPATQLLSPTLCAHAHASRRRRHLRRRGTRHVTHACGMAQALC
eukprot:365087-Chlamydomonas_euryale.AAC.12